MRTAKQLGLIIILFGLSYLVAYGQHVPPDASIEIGSIASNVVTARIINLDGLKPWPSSKELPHYDVYWITGDGNFYEQRVDIPAGVAEYQKFNGDWFSFTYPVTAISNGYEITALAKDRYTDTEPPDDEMQGPTIPDDGSGFTPMNNVPPNRRIRIESSSYVAKEEKTVFAISYIPESTGRLHLFYNGEVDPATGSISTISGFNKTSSDIPNYHNMSMTALDGIESGISSTSSNYYGYQDHLQYNITADDYDLIKNSIVPELRIFHTLEGDPSLTDNLDVSFLAVLTSEVDINTPSPLLGGLDSVYGGNHIVDIDSLIFKTGEPHDPNELIVTDINQVTNKSKVYFRLRFCNESDVPAIGANVFIEDLNDQYSQFTILDRHAANFTPTPAPKFGPFNQADPAIKPNTRRNDFSANSMNLDNYWTTSESEACGFIHFYAYTNPGNIPALYDVANNEIKACVQFMGPSPRVGEPPTIVAPICAFNKNLEECKEQTTCPEVECCKTSLDFKTWWPLWITFFLSIIILIIVFLIYQRLS